MDKKFFFQATSVVFAIIFVLHILRLLYDWSFVVNETVAIPMWFSYLAIVISGILGYFGFKFSKWKK